MIIWMHLKIRTKSKGTKPLLVFAILLSAASLTIQILQMLGIL